nr:hypothetical protein [Candidatus Sigynarchaeota archaeon]
MKGQGEFAKIASSILLFGIMFSGIVGMEWLQVTNDATCRATSIESSSARNLVMLWGENGSALYSPGTIMTTAGDFIVNAGGEVLGVYTVDLGLGNSHDIHGQKLDATGDATWNAGAGIPIGHTFEIEFAPLIIP